MDLDNGKKERRQIIKKEGSKNHPVKSDNESPESKSSRMESESHHRSSKSRQSRTPSDKLLHLRHRLQRMTLKDDIEILDTEKIDEVFTEVENFHITIPLLKESKI
ncbi:unnamed protein product, partial [Rhizophagus irregularis]